MRKLLLTALLLALTAPASASDFGESAALIRSSDGAMPPRGGSIVTLARDFLPSAAPPRGGSIVTLARDDGRYANSPLKSWFDRLASGKGLCCSFADGFKIEDVDWDTQDGHYRVRLNGEWMAVPDNALVTEPNKFGPAVVWPYMSSDGSMQIRCFLPGAGT